MNPFYRNVYVLMLLGLLIVAPAIATDWNDNKSWKEYPYNPNLCNLSIDSFENGSSKGIQLNFTLNNYPSENWAIMEIIPDDYLDLRKPIVFNLRAEASCTFEIKMIDNNETKVIRKIPMASDRYRNWTTFVVYNENLDYDWPPKRRPFNKFKCLQFAFSSPNSNETGTVWFSDIGIGNPSMNSTIFDRQNAILRRSENIFEENDGVLNWLEAVQDNGSPDKELLPSDGIVDKNAQTYNNAIVAMAFILKDKRERAERILDFYANSTKPENKELGLQNFFYEKEARGFFQQVAIKNYSKNDSKVIAYHIDVPSDRWMGDMCWLMLAYKYYETKYNDYRYIPVQCLLKGLILSWYNTTGGYIGSGWSTNNSTQVDARLHADNGHPEGNIDAYAALNLSGEPELANIYIKNWLENNLGNRTGEPLDCYAFRVLSGEHNGSILRYPDEDPRYQKTIYFQEKEVKGVYGFPIAEVDEIRLESVGQLACAFFEADEKEKGYFLANQMDNCLIDDLIKGRQYKALPYSITNKGNGSVSISCAAWYIFAKNQFNPMMLKSNKRSWV